MLDETNSAIQKHIDLVQSIIDRMASNSSNCKNWCITVISAILVIAYDKSDLSILDLSFVPLLLFFFLDSYYLSMERELRLDLKRTIMALHSDSLEREQLYIIDIEPGLFYRIIQTFKVGLTSASTLPFYSLFLILLVFARWFL